MTVGLDSSAGSSLTVDATDFEHSFGLIPGPVWAFRIHDDGSSEPLAVDEPIAHRRDGWLWLHLNLADVRASNWLRQVNLPAAAVGLMLARDKHQQLHTSESCTYGVFADLLRDIGGTADELSQLRFIMTERLVISARHRPVNSAEAARQALERGECRVTHAAALLELIVQHAADGIDRLTDDLADELDTIEDELSVNVSPRERQRIGRVRRTNVRIHRQLAGLRALFHRLERSESENISAQLRIVPGKLAQHLDSLDHDVIEVRDRATALQEEAAFVVAEETNRHLHFLSVVTALFLPATLITGVFGMNVKGLPFIDTNGGFLWTVFLMVAAVGAIYLVLWKMGVFKT
jgi:zinc transporter